MVTIWYPNHVLIARVVFARGKPFFTIELRTVRGPTTTNTTCTPTRADNNNSYVIVNAHGGKLITIGIF